MSFAISDAAMRPARRVLVTNDDGPKAAGLSALVGACLADAGNEVVVAVPATDMSSMGTALYLPGGAAAETWPSEAAWSGATGFEVAAYPSGIVTMAMMGAFGPRPDVVLAGVNHGLNLGRGLMHSATIGAALTAAVHGVPAAAFSAVAGADWAAWRDPLARLVSALTSPIPAGIVLSFNLPACPDPDRGAPVWCRPAGTVATTTLAARATAGGRQVLTVAYGPQEPNPDDTDAGVLARGLTAITSLALPYADPVGRAWEDDLSLRLCAAFLREADGHPA